MRSAFNFWADPKKDWIGYWFHRRLLGRSLDPVCQIAYQRVARVGLTDDGPIRFTVDRQIVSSLHTELYFDDSGGGTTFLAGQSIVELKYRKTMPEVYQKLIQELALVPQAISKYRLAIQSFLPDEAAKDGAAPKDGRNGSAVHLNSNGQVVPETRVHHPLPERHHA